MLNAREKIDEGLAGDEEENARRLLRRISEESFALIELSEGMEIVDDRLKFFPIGKEMIIEADQCQRFEIGRTCRRRRLGKRFLISVDRR